MIHMLHDATYYDISQPGTPTQIYFDQRKATERQHTTQQCVILRYFNVCKYHMYVRERTVSVFFKSLLLVISCESSVLSFKQQMLAEDRAVWQTTLLQEHEKILAIGMHIMRETVW